MSAIFGKQKTYDLSKDEKTELDKINNYHENIIGSLTLFTVQTDTSSSDVDKDQASINLQRPVTPLQNEIQTVPDKLKTLQEYIRRRIQPDNTRSLSVTNQLEIAGVIMGEINGCWRDIKQQIDYPFFNEEENTELNRRIILHVVTACVELFRHYCDKAEIVLKKEVFSPEANLSRLKVELSLETRKFLNVLIIRRYVTDDMKATKARKAAMGDTPQDSYMYPNLDAPEALSDREAVKQTKQDPLSFQSILTKSTPVEYDPRPKYKTYSELVGELKSALPVLEIEKLIPLIVDMPKTPIPQTAESWRNDTTDELVDDPLVTMKSFIDEPYQEMRLRSDSQPELRGSMRLANEIDLDLSSIGQKHKEVDDKLLSAMPKRDLEKEKTRIDSLSDSLIRSDLQNLAKPLDPFEKTNNGNEEEDLPPLIQASEMLKKEENRLEKLKRRIEELDAKARKTLDEDLFEPAQPTHAQPTVITRTFNQMTIRTSDVRPTERQCLSRITQKMFDPIWNDITGEIDEDTVKELDKNLFKGEEIREVYREILKTVDQNHMSYTNDPIIEPCAEDITLTAMLASSSLFRNRKERIINPKLVKATKPPWSAGSVPKQWAKPNVFTPGDKKGVVNLAAVVDTIVAKEVTQEADIVRQKAASKQETAPRIAPKAPNPKYVPTTEEFMKNIREMPKAVQERLLRSYQSWLTTWKADIDSEDFMKFLATQETDFMGLIFHIYDSDDDEDEVIIARRKLEDERKKAEKLRKEKLKQLLDEKTAFSPGFWNAQSVLMGGLGKDPDLPESPKVSELEAKVAESENEKLLKSARGRAKESIVFKTRYTEGVAPLQAKYKTKVVEKEETVVAKPALQERLEKLWQVLKFPENQRVDMAIKYGSAGDLEGALNSWEVAIESVLDREALIAELERFERYASDPNRFFSKGYRGSSQARIEEGKIRDAMYTKLDTLDEKVRKQVLELEAEYQDTLTYRGRPYLDKMKWDKVEMLYWLQEERRQTVSSITGLNSNVRSRSPIVLPPL